LAGGFLSLGALVLERHVHHDGLGENDDEHERYHDPPQGRAPERFDMHGYKFAARPLLFLCQVVVSYMTIVAKLLQSFAPMAPFSRAAPRDRLPR
jgi:hypothetical protein